MTDMRNHSKLKNFFTVEGHNDVQVVVHDGQHYVRLLTVTMTFMVTGKPWVRKVAKANKPLIAVSQQGQQQIFDFFSDYYANSTT